MRMVVEGKNFPEAAKLLLPKVPSWHLHDFSSMFWFD